MTIVFMIIVNSREIGTKYMPLYCTLNGWVYSNGFSWTGAKLGSFAMAAVFSLSCWAFGYWMDRRKWYWRV